MNFTREPIIETIITPKEGNKLVVRNSKGGSQEEYSIDALEVVSFGNALFFRSMERPKSFLVPVSDYEVVETKETRVVLKNAPLDRSIKIGGGKEAGKKSAKATDKSEEIQPAAVEERLEKKRERRRHRRKRTVGSGEEESKDKSEASKPPKSPVLEGGDAADEMKISSSPIAQIIPPPPQLIANKYPQPKLKAPESPEGNVPSEPPVEEAKAEGTEPAKEAKPRRRKKTAAKSTKEEAPEKANTEEPPKVEKEEEPPSPQEGGEVRRVAQEVPETVSSTSFSTLNETNTSFGYEPW